MSLSFYWRFFLPLFLLRVSVCMCNVYKCLLKSNNFNTASTYVCVCVTCGQTISKNLISFSHSSAAAAAIDSIIWYPVVWWIGDTINIWLWLSALILAITSLPSPTQYNQKRYHVIFPSSLRAGTLAHIITGYVVNIWAKSNAQHLLFHFSLCL